MLVVKKAVDLLRADDDLARLGARLQPFIDGLFMGFTVQDLDWLKMGGRVRALAAFIGGMLNIKPIIRLQDARLIPTDKMRCKKPALKKLVGMAAKKYRQRNGQCHVWLAYSDNLEEAMTTRAKLAARLTCPADRINLAEVGATISVHTGPGAICITMSPA